jgi:cell division protein FtsW (lipid II flippase)
MKLQFIFVFGLCLLGLYLEYRDFRAKGVETKLFCKWLWSLFGFSVATLVIAHMEVSSRFRTLMLPVFFIPFLLYFVFCKRLLKNHSDKAKLK